MGENPRIEDDVKLLRGLSSEHLRGVSEEVVTFGVSYG